MNRDVGARVHRQATALKAMAGRSRSRRQAMRERHSRSPRFRDALTGDVAATLGFRGEGRGPLSRTETVAEAARLALFSDAFLAQVMYRARTSLLRRGVPVVPRLLHMGSMITSQVCIGDPVVIQPGLYLPHGQVVVDGITEIGRGVILFPWVTIGLRGGNFHGPTVGNNVHIGTGSKVVGPVRIGDTARTGANAVILTDVPAQATVVGVPGRVTGRSRTREAAADAIRLG